MFCGNCGTEIKEGLYNCSNCGWTVPQRTSITNELLCSVCGFVNKKEAIFCGNCGNKIDGDSTSGNGVKQCFNIGDTGPGGGLIFYDKIDYIDGWRYLEVCPASTEFSGIQWGACKYNWWAPKSVDIPGTRTGIGTGRYNTQIIINQLGLLGESGRAAQVCAELVYGGFRDWFLPSKDELNLIYKNLTQNGLEFFNQDTSLAFKGVYWSSSQSSKDFAWTQFFGDGRQYGHGLKCEESLVRAIRAF